MRAYSAWFLWYCYTTLTFFTHIYPTHARAHGKLSLTHILSSSSGWHTNQHRSPGSGAPNSSHHGVTEGGFGALKSTSSHVGRVSFHPKVPRQCLQKGGSVHISAMSGEIHLGGSSDKVAGKESNTAVDTHDEQSRAVFKPAERNDSNHEHSHKCLVELSVPTSSVLKLALEFCSEIDLQAYELRTDKDNTHESSPSSTYPQSQNDTPGHEFHDKNASHSFLNKGNSTASQFGTEPQTRKFANGGNGTAGTGEERRVLLIEGCDAWYPPSHVFSKTSTVWLTLKSPRTNTRRKSTLRLRFFAVTKSEAYQLQLQVFRTSSTTGYVQTPDWDGTTKQYRRLMRSCVTVAVPEGRAIFLTFVKFVFFGKGCGDDDNVDVDSEFLSVYNGSCSLGTPRTHQHCSFVIRRPWPYVDKNPSSSISLFFVSNSVTERESFGFRALYSFHNPDAILVRLRRGKWNCSTRLWPDFVQHFPCDLVSQCHGGEDEARCPYTGSRCGLGKIEVRGRCYEFLGLPYYHTIWEKANLKCSQKGSILASLETPQEWDDVIQLLSVYGDSFLVFIGLKTPENDALPMIYRNAWQWQTGVMAYQLNIKGAGPLPFCGSLTSSYFRGQNNVTHLFFADGCGRLARRLNTNYLCELPSPDDPSAATDAPSQHPPTVAPSAARRESSSDLDRLVTCPQGHLTFKFAACAAESACWVSSSAGGECQVPLTPLPPSFECADGLGSVPYTLVCDFRRDCRDASDENFCNFPPCVGNMLPCGDSGQCYTRRISCNQKENCLSGADEAGCNRRRFTLVRKVTSSPPAVVVFLPLSHEKLVNRIIVRPTSSPDCPPAHFRCAGDGYCLPVFVRCNGVIDCPGRDDELGCDSYTCPGFYRCRGSRICIHTDELCDRRILCPQHDDELLCGLPCPDTCTCYGLSFFCHHKFPAEEHPSILFLEARGTGLSLDQVANNTYLVHLGLADCGVGELSLIQLPRLHSLDLRDNNLQVVDMRYMEKLRHLKKLILAGNPLTEFMLNDESSHVHMSCSLHELDLSGTLLKSLNESSANVLTNMIVLNVSHSDLNTLYSFETFANLRILDMRKSRVAEFEPKVLRGMHDLRWMYADNPKLCCSDILPAGFNLNHCFAPVDEISSCDALLRSVVYRVALTMFSVLTLIGNLFCFVYRIRLPPSVKKLGFNAFVTQLCLSDFLMGVYLAVIGVADRAYLGSYLWKDVAWKSSAACKMAGFFSLLSSETSAMIVCLITVERFIVIRFPFSRVHFIGRSAYVASAVSWLIGLVLASVPLLPTTRHWKFYSQTGICIPLPINRRDFPGHSYSFGVMIVCNLGLFVLIAVGQALIYLSVQANTMTSVTDSSSKAKDARIARRLLTVVMSDFMCWFPIGLCGVLSSNGYPVPGEVNVAMAIFFLPLNSALNPFLYTLNLVLEKRQKIQEERIKKFLLSKIKTGELVKTLPIEHR